MDGNAVRENYAKASWLQRHPGLAWLLLIAPVLVYLLLAFAYPLVEMVLRSVFTPSFTLHNYARIFGGTTYLILIWNTVRVSLAVAFVSLLIGYPVAMWMGRLRGFRLSVAMMLVILPLWTSVLVRNYAWIILLRRGGPISSLIEAVGLHPPDLLYSEGTVILGMVYTLLPYMVFTLYNAMRTIDARYAAAARGLGASPFRAFVKVFFPLSMPAVSAGFLLVFVISIGFFITPALLGGGHVEMIAPQIDTQMNTLIDWGFGAALSTVLFVIVALVMAASVGLFDVEVLGFEKRRPVAVTAGPTAQMPLDIAAAQRVARPLQHGTSIATGTYDRPSRSVGRIAAGAFSVVILVILLAPIIVIAGTSFSGTPFLTFPPRGLSLKWYRAVIDDPSWIDAAILSIKSAFLTMCSAVILGTLAAVCLVRGRFPGRQLAYVLVMSPLIVPTIIVAVGVYFLFIGLGLLGSIWSFVLAYTMQTLPLVVLVVSSALRRVDVSLERSAVILGASPARAFFAVTLPAIWPAVLASGIFAFIHAFDDVVIAEFIAGTTVATLPKKMWVALVYSIDPTISVVSTIFIAVSVLLLSIIGLARAVSARKAA